MNTRPVNEVAPALTPEDWREGPAFVASDRTEALISATAEAIRIDAGRATLEFHAGGDRHALAALALHGQPFGFTWQDHDRHTGAAAALDAVLSQRTYAGRLVNDPGSRDTFAAERAWHRSMADRIAALLPPRDA